MYIVAPSPFNVMAYRQFDAAGDMDCVVLLKASLVHIQNGHAILADRQQTLTDSDVYADYADPANAPLVMPTDVVPAKQATDVTFIGKTYAPTRAPSTGWTATLGVGPLEKTLTVSGPRTWQKHHPTMWERMRGSPEGWLAGHPEPVESVPIDWREAAGGWSFDGDKMVFDTSNPVGRSPRPPGPEADPHDDATLPSLSSIGTNLAGYGPLAPFYRGRQRYVGTYDEEWVAHRHPLLPLDFDPRFWNTAPDDQIISPPLEPASPYILQNLSSSFQSAQGWLPDWRPSVVVHSDGTQASRTEYMLALNDVRFDWRDEHFIILVWRVQFPLPDAALTQMFVDPFGAIAQTEDRRQA